MKKRDTARTEQGVLNLSFDDIFEILQTVQLQFDGSANLQRSISPMVAKKITSPAGNYTYFAIAAPGTLQSASNWLAWRIEVNGDDTIWTFADGNIEFDNVATDLTALTYA